MRKIVLAPGVESSILGFGCAPVLGAVGGKVADRALNVAYDGGVTHFDVARSYGYGEAESFLGKFMEGRREEVVIASKFGIEATWKANLLRPLKPLVRSLRARQSKVDPEPAVVQPPASPPTAQKDPFHQRVPLTPESMQRSLHQSLKALRTDYLDVFFIHEPTGTLEFLEPLLEQAEMLKQQGKIRTLGLATDWSNAQCHAPYFNRFDVLQMNNSPEAEHYREVLETRQNASNVFFSPFRERRELSPSNVLNQLWQDFPNSVVLCSMFNPQHIEANIKAADLADRVC